MTDFSFYYKTTSSDATALLASRSWDVFISAYNSADRVNKIFSTINAKNKYWILFNEYGYERSDFPSQSLTADTWDEADFIINIFSMMHIDPSRSICIDSTGFIRPYLAFLILYLNKMSFKKIDIIYTEPKTYFNRDKTTFCLSSDLDVRQIRGFEGSHALDTNNDILLINSGYDSDLITRIAESKKHARKIQLFGFPSLRPDMFQENILRAYKSHESIGISLTDENSTILAPANDPFSTAQAVSDKLSSIDTISNLYISPLATKPQLIGLILYFIKGVLPCPTSLIFPFSKCYSKETAIGTARTWIYQLEF